MLLARQSVVLEILYYLQRALDLALRVCPAGSDGRFPVGAADGEAAIWRKVTGFYPDLRHVQELGEATTRRLWERERALRRLDEEGDETRTTVGRAPKARPRPSHAPGGDEHPGLSSPTRSRSPPTATRVRPSMAPHLRPPASALPVLRPWWNRTVGELVGGTPTGGGATPDEAAGPVRPPLSSSLVWGSGLLRDPALAPGLSAETTSTPVSSMATSSTPSMPCAVPPTMSGLPTTVGSLSRDSGSGETTGQLGGDDVSLDGCAGPVLPAGDAASVSVDGALGMDGCDDAESVVEESEEEGTP